MQANQTKIIRPAIDMNTIKLTVNNGLAIVTLDRGRSNPINTAMVNEIADCVKMLEQDDSIGGLILTGKEGFFTSGVDLIEAYQYDEIQIREFWTVFLQLQATLTSFKKPMVAAITGHSPAGGCIMALCCDYRVMAEGDYIIGLNEVPVGIIVPDIVFDLFSFWIGERLAYQSLLTGKLFKTAEALSIGLVDEVCPAENVLAAAESKVRTFMKLNPATWSQTKLNLRKGLLDKGAADQRPMLDLMLKQWWAPENRAGLQKMIENLQAKKNA